jgi:hypothetical protein
MVISFFFPAATLKRGESDRIERHRGLLGTGRTNAFMKDAGKKAAATRALKGSCSKAALKAWATRRDWAKKAHAVGGLQ